MANLNIGRKSGFIMRGGVRRRETLWFGNTGFAATLAATTSVALVTSLSASALSLRPFTIIRTRGQLHCRSDQQGASESYGGSYGVAVVSDQAVAAGITAVPTPTVDSDSDLWHVYEFLIGRFNFGSSASFADVGITRIVDSKAMRKVEDGQDMVEVIEGPGTGITATGCVMSGFVRTLVKLH